MAKKKTPKRKSTKQVTDKPKKKKKSRKGIKKKSKNGKAMARAGRKKITKGQDVRHRKFAKEIAKGKSQAEAARLAGYSPSGADVQGSRLIRNVKVQELIVLAMEEMGLNDKTLLTVLKSGLKATKLVGAMGVSHPDFPTRLHAVRLAYELKGVIGKSRSDEEVAQDEMALVKKVVGQIAGVIHLLVTDKALKRRIAMAVQKISDGMRYEEAKRLEREGR